MIREAELTDIYEASNLWEQMVLEKNPEYCPDKELWREAIKDLMEQTLFPYKMLVAVEKRMVGFIDGMAFKEPMDNKIHGVGKHFYIIPERRNSYLAARLYKRMLSIALDHNVEVFEFHSFNGEVPFWLKRGFVLNSSIMRMEL